MLEKVLNRLQPSTSNEDASWLKIVVVIVIIRKIVVQIVLLVVIVLMIMVVGGMVGCQRCDPYWGSAICLGLGPNHVPPNSCHSMHGHP